MPIDVDTRYSPGWYLKRTFDMLAYRPRRVRLQKLFNYQRGNPPMPQGAENARVAYEVFQRKARSNFADLVTSAMSERMIQTGIRTAVDDDATGDAEMGALWLRAGMNVITADTHDNMLGLSEGFVIVGGYDPEIGAPQVTCEDPRFMVGDYDPGNPNKMLASLKVLHDDASGQDRAYLFLRGGHVHVATRRTGSFSEVGSGLYGPTPSSYVPCDRLEPLPNFDPRAWDWDEERSGTLRHGRMPVVAFKNKYGMGEFEQHIDLLDRINHGVLQRMIIAVMQAWRQRAIRGLPLRYPEDHAQAGQLIDYNEIFSADPAALWTLPLGADVWESAINDLTPILKAIESDVKHLGSVTRTPLYMLAPDGTNQSAEGSSLSREGLVFKTSDRIERVRYPWNNVASLIALHAGMPERADMAKLSTIWASVERLSLAERSLAVGQLKDVLPRRTIFIMVMGMSPQEADRAMTELADEQLLAAQVQLALAAAAPQTAQASTSSPAVAAITAAPAAPASQPAPQPSPPPTPVAVS